MNNQKPQEGASKEGCKCKNYWHEEDCPQSGLCGFCQKIVPKGSSHVCMNKQPPVNSGEVEITPGGEVNMCAACENEEGYDDSYPDEDHSCERGEKAEVKPQPKESEDWEETIRGIGWCGGDSPEGVPSREHDDYIIDIIRSLKSRWQSEAREEGYQEGFKHGFGNGQCAERRKKYPLEFNSTTHE